MPRALLAVLLALLVVTPVALAATTLANEVSNATANEQNFMKAFDAPAAAVGDFNKDGKPEIVAHNDNLYLYVLSTTEPRVLAELKSDYPGNWGVRPINDPAVADVDGDGWLDIVEVNSEAVVCLWTYQPAASTASSFSFRKAWCDKMDAYDGSGAAADAGASVADVNGDGRMEIFSQTEKLGLFAYNWDGSVRWSKGTYGGNSGPLISDLDGDGRKEVVFFGDGGEVKAFDASSGASKWSFWASNYVKPASIPVAGNAADLDGDGRKEVVFTARDAPPGDTVYTDNHLGVFVLSHNGVLKKWWQPSWGNPLSYTHPVLLDVNGDGRRDILLQDWNTIGHKPGNWEKLGPANVFAYTWDGTLLWRTQLDNTWSNDDLAVADVDGDGAQEVLAIGWGPSGDGVWSLDLRTGAKEQHVGVGSGWIALRGPVAGNLGGDGKTWWAISIYDSTLGGAYKVFRTDAACSVAFGGWANADPCGGGSTTPPPPPPPPPTGDFSATFTPTAGNEWWVQVKVNADQPLAGVDARVNGGSWKPLTLRSWGDWAASVHAPSGSIVQFQARSASGETALSGCYRWTDRAPVACPGGSDGGGTTPPPPPPPTNGTFAATFKNVRGNEWWVETDVSVTGGTLAGVDARVNGGTWVPLAKQSWGSWAKSVHAPPGSTVEFRARAADGQTATSGAYRWPPG